MRSASGRIINHHSSPFFSFYGHCIVTSSRTRAEKKKGDGNSKVRVYAYAYVCVCVHVRHRLCCCCGGSSSSHSKMLCTAQIYIYTIKEKKRKRKRKEYLHPRRNPILFEKHTVGRFFLVVASFEGSHATRYTTYQRSAY